MSAAPRPRPALIGAAAAVAAVATVAAVAVWTRPTRESVRTYTALIDAANRQDMPAAERLCSARYRASHRLRPAPDGGLVGLPRNIHKNFQVWRAGAGVWLCPTNRVGPVYQFVHESGAWRFDGPVGVLLPGGRVARISDEGEEGGLGEESTADDAEGRR
jgi:hypothetical protein